MKVPLTWLNDLVDINQPVEKLADLLSMAGFEVESIEDYSSKAQGVLVGFVEKIEKHPEADKLSICQVNIGNSQCSQIVCGASNIRSNVHVLVATPGAFLSSINLKIKVTKLRGIESAGMICSLGELGITTSSEGIAILEDFHSEIPRIGSPVLKMLGLDEKVLDIAITANRPDGMSIDGIAREVSALTESTLRIPELQYKIETKLFNHNSIDNDLVDKNGLFTLTTIGDLDGGTKSPKWLKSRLQNCGINSLNAIVDITNYIQLEQGQPQHAYDLDKLEVLTGKSVNHENFSIRKASDAELFTALDGNTYNLNSKCTLITCHDIPIAIAGVIGGLQSAVSDSTKRIVLECALFNPTSVRNSARSVGIRTESSSRFEKGISVELILPSLARYIDLLSEVCKPKVQKTSVDKNIKRQKKTILLRKDRINKILGTILINNQTDNNYNPNESNNSSPNYIADSEIELKLRLLGCKLNRLNADWEVVVPSYRSIDLIREIDLIEEIARLIGYDKFDVNLPAPIKPGGMNRTQLAERKLRSQFIGAGFQEITTVSLVGPPEKDEQRIAISNPLLAETSHLRTNFWDEHLKVCFKNLSSGQKACWLFEIGCTYLNINNQIHEQKTLGGVLTGNKRFGAWYSGGKKQKLDYFQARGYLEQALSPLKIKISDRQLTTDKLLHPGRASSLYLEGKSIGKFGQIYPTKADELELDPETFIFELDLKSILNSTIRDKNWSPIYKDFPTVPFMERDIAISVDKNCSSQEIIDLVRKTGKPLLESVELIDRYEGQNITEGKVSQAFRIRYRDQKKTLKESEINPIHQKIIEELEKSVKAELRK